MTLDTDANLFDDDLDRWECARRSANAFNDDRYFCSGLVFDQLARSTETGRWPDLNPSGLRKSLTWDRGCEMAEHQKIAGDLELDVYFCDPRSPWQRGSNENTNRLLRQYLAKGADLREFSIRDLDDIAQRINTRPRHVINSATSAELFRPNMLEASVPQGNRPPKRLSEMDGMRKRGRFTYFFDLMSRTRMACDRCALNPG